MRARTLTGRRASAAPLIGDAELEHLRLITLQHRSRRWRAFPATAPGGSRPTRWRGQGMELHDARPYQPGDDLRHLDWRATARSGKPVTKVFVEERARNLFLLIDRRPSMMFGTRRELKAATAARVAAILAFSALAEREAVSGLVLERGARYFPPVRSLDGVLALLHAAAAAPDTVRAAPPAPGPESLTLERGTTCCVISDFLDVTEGRARPEDCLPPAYSGAGSGDRIAIRIVDPAEEHLPDAGLLRLIAPGAASDVGPVMTVDTSDPELRRRFRASVLERDAALRRACARSGMRLLTISNDADLPAQLKPLL